MREDKHSNYQDLLKTLAIFFVIVDHIGMYFFPKVAILRVIGRAAMPIFCFFVGYNFTKPKAMLVIFGVILTSMFMRFFDIYMLNMLLTMYIAQWYLWVVDRYNYKLKEAVWLQIIFLLFVLFPSEYLMEYGTMAIVFTLIGYFSRRNGNNLEMIAFAVLVYTVNNIYKFKFCVFDSAVAILGLSAVGFALYNFKHLSNIKWNLRWISRNTLYIYFFDVFFSMLLM